MGKKVSEALTGRGVRGLSGYSVETLITFVKDKSVKLCRVEAKRIEPQYDRDMPEYSIYGSLPPSGEGFEVDKAAMTHLFLELNEKGQAEESYALRYDIWLAEN